MRIRAARDHPIALVRHRRRQHLRIGHDLRRIGRKIRLQRLLEGHRLGRDDMHQRPTLLSREHAAIDARGKLRRAQDHAATRPTQRLVCGRRHHVRVRYRRRMCSARHQTGKVRHVHHQVGAHLVGDRAHPGKVEDARVRAASAHDHLRPLLHRQRLQLVIVDHLGILPHLVADDAVQLAREVELMTMRQVSAMRQVQPQDGVAGLQQRHVRRRVRLRPRVRLYVCMLRAKQLLRPLPRQRLDHVGVLAAAVVALAGVALGVLVGEDRPRRLEHRAADKVLRRNHLQPLVLARNLILYLGRNLGIGRGKGGNKIYRHVRILPVHPVAVHSATSGDRSPGHPTGFPKNTRPSRK